VELPVSEHFKEFASSPNGDRWLLGRHDENGFAYVQHRANGPSGGIVTAVELGAFLTQGPLHPQQHELLKMIGTLVDAPATTRSGPNEKRTITETSQSARLDQFSEKPTPETATEKVTNAVTALFDTVAEARAERDEVIDPERTEDEDK
jgi:hypothetical protein